MSNSHTMFLDNDAHYGFMQECIKMNPKKTVMSTYGIYAGVLFDTRDTTKFGDKSKYGLYTRDILDELVNFDDVSILVGISTYKSCKPNNARCIDCETNYAKQLIRIVNHAETFPSIKWKMTNELHLKCSLFFYDDMTPLGVAGGRNFTNSDWADITFELAEKQIETLNEYFQTLWNVSRDVDDDTCGAILKENMISEKAIERLYL